MGLVGDEIGKSDIEQVGALSFGRIGPESLTQQQVSSESGGRDC